MNDIKIIFVFLRIVLFLVFLASGYFLSKSETNKQYWKIAFFPIIAFAVISGLRFGREVDYNVYYNIYSFGVREGEEFLFAFLINIFNDLAIPYSVFVLFCSTFLIISFLYVLSKFKVAAFFVLPLFLCYIVTFENLIRWFFAFSFVFIALGKLIDKRYYMAVCLSIVSYFIHEGMIIIVSLIGLFYIFTNKKILFHPIIALILFTTTLMLGSIEYLQQLGVLLNYFQFDFLSDRGEVYMNNIEDITSGEFGAVGVLERTIFSNIRLFVCYAFPLYFGAKYFKENETDFPDIKWLYNLTVFSIIIMPLFSLVELFNRISEALMALSLVVVGITIFISYQQRDFNKIAYRWLLISFLFLLYPVVKNPFDRTENHEMLFIWDANGRESLPLEYFERD